MRYNEQNELRIKLIKDDHYIEDSVLWYIFPFEENYYLGLSIHQRINHKQSLFIE
ncbi:hypothetical protein [Tenacibaculum halocynthiae]|uniref:hypothetical protein n=1 Tax=Tenacibaculum halocynthiae TaxID=1254437 RepID=UPI003895B64D